MPKLDLRQTAEQELKTLADVPEREWWIRAGDGKPVQRSNDTVVWYDVEDNTFNHSVHKAGRIPITRRLCGPIELIWE